MSLISLRGRNVTPIVHMRRHRLTVAALRSPTSAMSVGADLGIRVAVPSSLSFPSSLHDSLPFTVVVSSLQL